MGRQFAWQERVAPWMQGKDGTNGRATGRRRACGAGEERPRQGGVRHGAGLPRSGWRLLAMASRVVVGGRSAGWGAAVEI